jgi:hypothetical protein
MLSNTANLESHFIIESPPARLKPLLAPTAYDIVGKVVPPVQSSAASRGAAHRQNPNKNMAAALQT